MQSMGRLQAGQTINSDDSTLIQDAYNSVYQLLQKDHAVDWGPDDDIPQAYEVPITQIVKFHVSDAFGVPPDAIRYALAEKSLKKSLAIDDSGEPAKVQDF